MDTNWSLRGRARGLTTRHRHPSPAKRPSRWRSATVVSALVAAGTVLTPLAPAPVVQAGTVITVTTTEQKIGGPGGCSLQEAILAANHDSSIFTAPGNDSVEINSACAAGSDAGPDIIEMMPGAYLMGPPIDDQYNHMGPAATPMITSDIIIEGRGALLVRAYTGALRAFVVGPDGALDLREVHVRGFAARGGNGSGGGGGGLGAGGAIYAHGGSLLVQWSTFELNTATGGNGSTGNQFDRAGGGGGGLGGRGGRPGAYISGEGGGGGGARGDGGDVTFTEFPGPIPTLGQTYGGGGGTVGKGGHDGGFRCGGRPGRDANLIPFTGTDGDDGCAGGGGGGGVNEDKSPGGSVLTFAGDGGAGGYGGGGGGGGDSDGDGGQGGFGGGGGAGPAFNIPGDWFGGSGADGGFGGGGGAGPGGDVFGEPGEGGTFAGNARDVAGGGGAGLGGAIFGHSATIVISNSTFTRNAAVRGVGGTGGGDTAQNGADAGGAIFTVAGSLTIRNSTIAGNESTGDGAGVVVYRPTTGDTTTLRMYNTIVANNTGHDECFVLGGVDRSGSNNLITPHPLDDNRTECLGVTQTGDPMLGALQLNWPGRTPTMALLPGSPAIDTAGLLEATPDDQRGVQRPQIITADMGAYEWAPGLDTTPPGAHPTAAPAPNANGWNNTPVTVTWNWTDETNGTGVNPVGCATTTSTMDLQGEITIHAFCEDYAGNEGEGISIVKVDLTAPTVTCATAPTFTVGDATASVSATVTDRHAGPAATTVTSAVSPADVAAPGTKSVNVTGEDLAGNATTVACPFDVKYGFGGFLEPIPQSSYRRGSNIPVRFQLTNAAGVPIPDSVAAALLAPVCRVRLTLAGVDKGCMRYDAAANKFVLDLKTSKSTAVGEQTITVVITAADGTFVTETSKVIIR
jgi:hypothetical protein